ncbi:MAG: virulence RhuM family protein [Phycisphaeraceae bacterium]|nr:virulence RhuM family protein [Phycisphaeraceae bacterium]
MFATSIDDDKNHPAARDFFATVRNKLHFAVHGQTAAEVVVHHARHSWDENMRFRETNPDFRLWTVWWE